MCMREPGFHYYTYKVKMKLRFVKVTRHEVCSSEIKCPFVLVILLPVKHLLFPGQKGDALIVELSISSRFVTLIRNYIYIFIFSFL